jgi:hypothetical protein
MIRARETSTLFFALTLLVSKNQSRLILFGYLKLAITTEPKAQIFHDAESVAAETACQ